MPDWKYLIARQIGRNQQRQMTCMQIKRQVEQLGMSTLFPQVKYERGSQKEYYLGLALDFRGVPDGGAERLGREILLKAGIRDASNPHSCFVVPAEQAQTFLTGSLGCERFTTPISYETGQRWEFPPGCGLASISDMADIASDSPDIVESESYARLLYWCSAVGSGRLDRFREGCQTLGEDKGWGEAWSVLRRLVLLGHLEFDGGAQFKWSVIRPTTITPVEDSDLKVLVGQRNPSILQYLRSRFHLQEQHQPNGPPIIFIESPDEEISYRPNLHFQEAGCVAHQLSEQLPALEDWIMRLPAWEEKDFGRFSIEQYDSQFDAFRKVSTSDLNFPVGLYRFTLEHTRGRMVTDAFFDDFEQRWICGDFYGLRFITRARSGLCRAGYFNNINQLVIPMKDRWPMPYERALVLAAGALPLRFQDESGNLLLAYQGITPGFASCMSKLLSVELEGDTCSI